MQKTIKNLTKKSILLLILFLLTSKTTPQPLSSSSSKTPSTKAGECTPSHCLYCSTDGTRKWCSKCGNNSFLSSTIKGKGKCIKNLLIQNCSEPDPYDPTTADKCGKCKRGFYLSDDKTRCFKYIDFKCDLPYIWDGNRLCGGCKHHYIANDYTKCSKNKDLPSNCLYGDIERSKRCLKCKTHYILSKDRKSCEKFGVKGCKARHPDDGKKCLICDEELGYYAVDAEVKGKSIFQICKKMKGFVLMGIWGFWVFVIEVVFVE